MSCRLLKNVPVFPIVALATCVWGSSAVEIASPPNAPAEVRWDAKSGALSLRYHGAAILDAKVVAEDANGQVIPDAAIKLEPVVTRGDKEKVEQRLKFTIVKPKEDAKLVLRGMVVGSEEAFPAETQGMAQNRFPLVRNSDGVSCNLRNNAIYDRHWDWVLIGLADGSTRIIPKAGKEQGRTFDFQNSRQAAIELTFRPRFYQKHRSFAYFEPWTYKTWKGSVTGYCTWWAYKGGFNQKTLDAIVDVFAEKHLSDFGYKYVQIDDAYQTGNGSCPQNWLTWNGKFPGGAEYVLKKITSAGMQGGIWVHRVHRPSDPNVFDIGKKHPDWFVHKPDGKLFMDGGFYVLNTKNQEALNGMVRPIYRELRKQGWRGCSRPIRAKTGGKWRF